MRQTRDGGYIVVGRWGLGAALIKLDSLGDTLWRRAYAPPGEFGADFNSVLLTPDRGYIAAGDFMPRHGAICVYVMKTDSLGDSVWTRRYCYSPDSVDSQELDISPTRDGGYIIFGDLTGIPPSNVLAGYLVRIDSLGDLLWTRAFADPVSPDGGSVRQTRDGGFIVATFSGDCPGPNLAGRLLRVDSLGGVVWSKLYGDSGALFHVLMAVDTMPDGGFIAAGCGSQNDTDAEAWLVRTDQNGDTLWTRYYGTKNADASILRMCRSSDGGFVGVGELGISMTVGHVYVIKVAENGDFEWSSIFGRTREQFGEGISRTSDGGYVVVGSDATDQPLVYVIKTDASGSAAIRSNPEKGTGGEKGIRLLPVAWGDPTKRIRYYVAQTGSVSLQLYDNAGRRERTLRPGMEQAGWHEIALPGDLPVGVHVLRLEACGQSAVVRLIILPRSGRED